MFSVRIIWYKREVDKLNLFGLTARRWLSVKRVSINRRKISKKIPLHSISLSEEVIPFDYLPSVGGGSFSSFFSRSKNRSGIETVYGIGVSRRKNKRSDLIRSKLRLSVPVFRLTYSPFIFRGRLSYCHTRMIPPIRLGSVFFRSLRRSREKMFNMVKITSFTGRSNVGSTGKKLKKKSNRKVNSNINVRMNRTRVRGKLKIGFKNRVNGLTVGKFVRSMLSRIRGGVKLTLPTPSRLIWGRWGNVEGGYWGVPHSFRVLLAGGNGGILRYSSPILVTSSFQASMFETTAVHHIKKGGSTSLISLPIYRSIPNRRREVVRMKRLYRLLIQSALKLRVARRKQWRGKWTVYPFRSFTKRVLGRRLKHLSLPSSDSNRGRWLRFNLRRFISGNVLRMLCPNSLEGGKFGPVRAPFFMPQFKRWKSSENHSFIRNYKILSRDTKRKGFNWLRIYIRSTARNFYLTLFQPRRGRRKGMGKTHFSLHLGLLGVKKKLKRKPFFVKRVLSLFFHFLLFFYKNKLEYRKKLIYGKLTQFAWKLRGGTVKDFIRLAYKGGVPLTVKEKREFALVSRRITSAIQNRFRLHLLFFYRGSSPKGKAVIGRFLKRLHRLRRVNRRRNLKRYRRISSRLGQLKRKFFKEVLVKAGGGS